MTLVGEELVIDGMTVDANISNSIIGATHTRTMDGAASIDLTVHDPNMQLLLSGVLTKPGKPTKHQDQFSQAAWDRMGIARLALDGYFFRLAGVDPSYDSSEQTITITFEDEVASILRGQTKARKSKRGQRITAGKHGLRPYTRADFIRTLLADAETNDRVYAAANFFPAYRFYSPQAGQVQPQKPPDTPTKDKQKGFGKAKFSIKGVYATETQKRLLAAALTEADNLHAPEKAMRAMIAAGIGESTWTNVTNSLGFGGVLQGQVATHPPPSWFGQNWFANMGPIKRAAEEAHSFMVGGRGYQGGGAIKLVAQHPDWSIGHIVNVVEGGGAGAGFYDKWGHEARDILDAWGGGSTTDTIVENFEFKAGGKQPDGTRLTWWDSTGDLAAEVNWRRFADANVLYFVSDDWLFTRRPMFILDGQDGLHGLVRQGVTSFRPSLDIGKPVGEIIIDVEAPRWTVPPGCVFDLKNLGPCTGRWLAWEVQHDLTAHTERAQVTLHRPAPKTKEPAPTVTTKDTNRTIDSVGSRSGYPVPHPTSVGGIHDTAGLPGFPARDYFAPAGSPVIAPVSGTVSKESGHDPKLGAVQGAGGPLGWSVYITHGNVTYYLTHMGSRTVNVGDKVTRGEKIGTVANYHSFGRADHIHMGVHGAQPPA